jgi:superkiller protein 3
MSNVKSLVKAAREALDRQDYPTALRLCDTGLQQEDSNYPLHVFRAVSLQNLGLFNEAIQCYRLATALQPNQPLAWQVI